ncbi:hypothetical protein [Pedobacter changchengzhani]|uniref:hypothetical protein n=1 Tax=Pedobacter changchengzhani TaxID=2529274 RepID=UPI0014053DF3|nr:hypothetical protein [Pedobacter changchengzhani]
MKNQEIKSNSVKLQAKKEWVKPELLTEEVERTLSGSIIGGAEGAMTLTGGFYSS